MRFVFAGEPPDGSETRIECLWRGLEREHHEVFLSWVMLRNLKKRCYC